MTAPAAIQTLLHKLARRDLLSEAERQVLVDSAGPRIEYPAGSDIVREGDRPDRSALLVAGFATRYRLLADGQRQITAIHVPGDFVDLHSLLLQVMDHSVGALSACSIVTYPHAGLRHITSSFPHLTRLLWLSTLIDGAIHREWLVAMGRRSALQQLAHLVCELHVRLEVAGLVRDGQFHLPITQSELGDALGLSVVHVNRLLQNLRSAGLIAWRGQTVGSPDWAALSALAEFDPRYLHLELEPR